METMRLIKRKIIIYSPTISKDNVSKDLIYMTEMSLYEGHGVLHLKCHIISKYLCQNEDVLKKPI